MAMVHRLIIQAVLVLAVLTGSLLSLSSTAKLRLPLQAAGHPQAAVGSAPQEVLHRAPLRHGLRLHLLPRPVRRDGLKPVDVIPQNVPLSQLRGNAGCKTGLHQVEDVHRRPGAVAGAPCPPCYRCGGATPPSHGCSKPSLKYRLELHSSQVYPAVSSGTGS